MKDYSPDQTGQELLRQEDHDRFLVTLFLPKEMVVRVAPLYALNAELAKTRRVVSEPALGEIRLQWWVDALEGAFAGHAPPHEIGEALLAVIAEGKLQKDDLLALVEAYREELYEPPLESVSEFTHHAFFTGGRIEILVAQALDGSYDAISAAQAVGTTWAVLSMLRALPGRRQQGWDYLPQDALVANDGNEAAVIEAMLKGTLEQMQLSMRTEPSGPIQALKPHRLLATLAQCYGTTIRKAGYDVASTNFERGTLWRFIRLMAASMRR